MSKPVLKIHSTFVREARRELGIGSETLHGLVQDVFIKCRRLTLTRFSKRGFSGALLGAADGETDAGSLSPCVLKLSSRDAIEREYRNYEDCVERLLEPDHRPALHAPPQFDKRWGILAYTQVGGRWQEIRTFADFYDEADVDVLQATLTTLFNEVMYPWFERRERRDEHLFSETFRIDPSKLNAIRKTAKALRGTPKSVIDPIAFWREACRHEKTSKSLYATVHGDLNSGNVLVAGDSTPRLIDFAGTGPRYYLLDFAKLESEIKFVLMDRNTSQNRERLKSWSRIDRLLDAAEFGELDLPAPRADPGATKAYDLIRYLRALALDRMVGPKDLHIRHYRIALLYYAIQALQFKDISRWKKLFAYQSAARLCEFYPLRFPVSTVKRRSARTRLLAGFKGDWSYSGKIADKAMQRSKGYFTICACIFEQNDYDDFTSRCYDLLQRHSAATLELRPDDHAHLSDLSRLIKDTSFRIIGLVADKRRFFLRRGNWDAEEFVVHSLFSVMCLYCELLHTQHSWGDVSAVSKGSEWRQALQGSYDSIYGDGGGQRWPGFFHRVLTSKHIKLKEDLRKHPGLQLARLLAPDVKVDILRTNGVDAPAGKLSAAIKDKYEFNGKLFV